MIFRRVLCPTDGSDVSVRGVSAAAQVAGRYQAELMILAAVNVPQAVAMAAHLDTRHYVEKLGDQCIRGAIEAIEQAGVGAEIKVVFGSPAEVILAQVDAMRCDLVVMGRRQWADARDLVLGSVSERVARHLKVPILLVP